METPEQKKDRDRLRSYIKRENLTCVLNDTKWSELLEALSRIAGVLDFRRKDVRDPDDSNTPWCSDLPYMLGGWENIEWLDIRAQVSHRQGALLPPRIEDHTDQLIDALDSVGIPYSRTDDGARIRGYLRPGISPEWANTKSTKNRRR